ncbi:hypothetical protein H2200_011353 [Cladophialophora chaetospira]|uniref:FHA domain-containing protein n=1 Tax=Cladophialophora chaetospira TaxID=386627 RepID=A0AA39CD53_9EURO|nr:hypothetical protein H2200_011353 [Cladophialophora chaetospira]
MAGTAPGLHVTVTLKDVNYRDPIPERTLVLEAPNWQVNIGRGTQSGYEDLTPAPNNAWFDSRVMSRSHAILRADPETKEITVEDVGSMHGTHLAGRRLRTHHVEPIWEGDTLILGADVTRGSCECNDTSEETCSDFAPAYFNALNILVTWTWSHEEYGPFILDTVIHTDMPPHRPHAASPRPTAANMYRNSFSVDYYSGDEISSEILGEQEEDDYEIYEEERHISEADDDIQIIQDSARQPSIEIIMPPTRTFTVPESDDGSTREGSSHAEISDEEVDESPVSSPIIPGNANEAETETEAKKSKIVTLSTSCSIAPGESASNRGQPETSQPSAAGHVDVNEVTYWSESDESSEVSSYAGDEPWNDHFASFGESYNASCHDEIAGPSIAGPSSSSGATQHQEHIRPPSPSDAAMPKPPGHLPKPFTTSAPPFNTFQPHGAPGSDMAGAALRPSSAWAGHNSVLWEPMPPYNLPAPLPPAFSYPRPEFGSYQAPSMAMSTQPMSPLSIPSLVEQQSERNKGISRKRKADDMSSDDSQSGGPLPELASSDVENIYQFPIKEDGTTSGPATVAMEDVTTAYTTTVPSEPASTVEVDESVSSAVTEPPRKKVKTRKAGSSKASRNGLVKMAAATITGMAIGAVGTIIGLAALPQEYFV